MARLRWWLTNARVRLGFVRRLDSLAPSSVARVRNAIAVVRLIGGRTPSRLLPFDIEYHGARYRLLLGNRSDPEVISEMLVEEEYEIDGIHPSVIVDAGSNIGASIAFFHSHHPTARIIGLEADPATFPRLQRSVGQVPGVELYQVALADKTGPVAFEQCAESWGSAIAAVGSGAGPIVIADGWSLPDLLSRLGLERVDLLKLDIEGGEWLIFEDPHALAACDVIVGELHHADPDEATQLARAALAGFDLDIRRGARDDRLLFLARTTTPDPRTNGIDIAHPTDGERTRLEESSVAGRRALP